MITKRGCVIRIQAADTAGNVLLSVRGASPIRTFCYAVYSPEGAPCREGARSAGGKAAFSVSFSVPQPRLWSTEEPCLYRAVFSVLYANGAEERAEARFGFRTLRAEEKGIFLNGSPFYVRGYIRGAAAHEHANLCCATEEEYYRKNITAAKRYGFNFIRFHSVVPNETFFRVADELGILVHIEFRLQGNEYDNCEEMRGAAPQLVSERYIGQTIDRLYEHPSLAVYCVGNELKNCSAGQVARLGRYIRKADPTRLYVDSCAWGANGRAGVDIDVQHMGYYFPFGKHAGMFEDTDNLLVCGSAYGRAEVNGKNAKATRTPFFKVPLIAHEVCHYTALRDLAALKQKFEKYGAPCPWWIGEEQKMIEAKGLGGEYDELYRASKYFQFECWKTAFEAIRASSLLSGFHFLQFADTDRYENSNGIADCFDDTDAVDRDAFLRFNADTVLLAKTGARLFRCGEEIAVPLLLSNYAAKKRSRADLRYTLRDGEGALHAKGGMRGIDLSRDGVYEFCKLHIRLPKKVGKLRLEASLTDGGTVLAENGWNLWAYPQPRQTSYRTLLSYAYRNVIITADIAKALGELRKGRRVCLIYRSPWSRHLLDPCMAPPRYAFRATWNRFKPVIWDRGTNYGGVCEDGLLTRYGFGADRFYDFNYSVLTEDCDKIVLDDFPVPVRSLVSGTDKSTRDRFDAARTMFNEPELQYDRTLRKFSYLFELRAGEGRLLVCGMNLTGLDRNEPSSCAFAAFLKRYLASDEFAPQTGLSVEELEEYLRRCARSPVKERMMTQFWQLDDAPVESQEYWKNSYHYLIRS